MKRFFFYIVIFFVFNGCKFISDSAIQNQFELVSFSLPQWDEGLPPLAFWIVEYGDKDSVYSTKILPSKNGGCCQCEQLILSVKKNKPYYILATPITNSTTYSSQNISFFKPAGAIYPFELDSSSMNICLSWSSGYAAFIYKRLLQVSNENNISDEKFNSFISSFNWNKFILTLKSKVSDNIMAFSESSSPKYFNPWLIDDSQILEYITNGSFSSSYLEMKYTYSVKTSTAGICGFNRIYSSFIPENDFIREYNCISLKKNVISIVNCDNLIAARLQCSSAKKVLHEFILLPIYNENYENF